MTRVALGERIYFAAVGALALGVGFWGYFVPSQVERWAIPFSVPPLHARFLGAVYLSGLAIMVGAMLARNWREIQTVPIAVALWTGGLCVISLFHLDQFPLSKWQSWVWFAAYVAYPLIAIALAWRHRSVGTDGTRADPMPAWVKGYFASQGVALTLLAVALLVAPATMVALWPWWISPFLAQIYSAPFLAYGVASLLLARRRTWLEVRVLVLGMLVFTAGVLLASLFHRALFSAADVADVVWFVLFAGVTAVLAVLSARSLARPGAGR